MRFQPVKNPMLDNTRTGNVVMAYGEFPVDAFSLYGNYEFADFWNFPIVRRVPTTVI